MKLLQSLKAIGVRRRAIKYANWLTVNQKNMPYSETDPARSEGWAHAKLQTKIPGAPDCSMSTGIILKAAGCPTPFMENGTEYTGTMLATLPHIPLSQTRRGDLVVFGAGTGKHVVMLLQGGRWHADPIVWSHGRPGIDVMPLSEMEAGFPGDPVTFLRAVPEDL